MRNRNHRPVEMLQIFLQNHQRFNIQIVRRLVEHERVRRREQRPRERETAARERQARIVAVDIDPAARKTAERMVKSAGYKRFVDFCAAKPATVLDHAGAVAGAAVDVPTAIAGFVCTSLFICLLFSQRLSRGNVVAAVSGAVSVAMFKFLGLTNIAVPASVVVGVVIALVCDAVFDGRGARDAR